MRLWFTTLRQSGAPASERISRIHGKFTAMPVEKNLTDKLSITHLAL